MNDHSSFYNKQVRTQVQFLAQLSDQEFWNYAQSLALEETMPLTTDEEYLECDTEQGHYLLPLRTLREVVLPPHKLTLLPLRPIWMLGITAWHSRIIPVVDFASYFTSHEMNETDPVYTAQHTYPRSNSTLLILDDSDVLLGIQVAVVGSITTIGPTQLASPDQAPSWYPRHLLTTVLGVYNRSVVLNPQVLISEMMKHIKVSVTYE